MDHQEQVYHLNLFFYFNVHCMTEFGFHFKEKRAFVKLLHKKLPFDFLIGIEPTNKYQQTITLPYRKKTLIELFVLHCEKKHLMIPDHVRYSNCQLIEINAHSLFSKWFSESGKLVLKMFDKIKEFIEDGTSFVCVLIGIVLYRCPIVHMYICLCIHSLCIEQMFFINLRWSWKSHNISCTSDRKWTLRCD